jgi:hypothetical protein
MGLGVWDLSHGKTAYKTGNKWQDMMTVNKLAKDCYRK